MTTARSQLVPPGAEGCYHCIQRCVRRAFLCGTDSYTGRSFAHRKTWIEDRLQLLGSCFAAAIHAYAVMDNHLHLVIQIMPESACSWSDDDVADRWTRLFPPSGDDPAAFELRRQRLLADPALLDKIRARLGNLSWFMRCLAEPIARRANREDGCKGRFWEGRFKCQVLCDERALLAAMTYVDLNPIRAGLAEQLGDAQHTSAQARIRASQSEPESVTAALRPILGTPSAPLSLSTAEYLQLLDWTGRVLVPGKCGRIAGDAPPVLAEIDSTPVRWMLRVRGYSCGWARAAGSVHDLTSLAKRIGQRWLRGKRFALQLS